MSSFSRSYLLKNLRAHKDGCQEKGWVDQMSFCQLSSVIEELELTARQLLLFCPFVATNWTASLLFRAPGYRSRCPGFDSRRCQIFREVVCLERGPFSLMNTTEELRE
jgi:hypothetical protein